MLPVRVCGLAGAASAAGAAAVWAKVGAEKAPTRAKAISDFFIWFSPKIQVEIAKIICAVQH
jgi:hypothetical protein